MTGPGLSPHFASRQPSAIRLAQIEFAKRQDGAEDLNVAIGNVSLPMHPALLRRMRELGNADSPFAGGVVKYSATVGLPETNAAFLEDPQLPVQPVDAVLPVSEEVEPLGAARQQLPRELASDAAASPGDQHAPAPQVCQARTQVHPHRLAGEQVFGVDVARLDQMGLALNDLRHARDDADLDEACALEEQVDLLEALG